MQVTHVGKGAPPGGPRVLLHQERESRGHEPPRPCRRWGTATSSFAQGHLSAEKVWPELNTRLF